MASKNITIEYKGDKYIFENDSHYHSLNGSPLMGVTTVIKKTINKSDVLVPWAVRLAVEHLQEKPGEFSEAKDAWKSRRDGSAKLGSDIHEEVENYFLDKVKPTIPLALKLVNEIENYCLLNKLKVIAVERGVWSKKLFVGGIIDLVLENSKGEIIIGDIKTGSGVYLDHWIQLGAYAGLLTSSSKYKKVVGLTVFHAPAKGRSVKILEKDNVSYYSEAFKKVLEVYKIINA